MPKIIKNNATTKSNQIWVRLTQEEEKRFLEAYLKWRRVEFAKLDDNDLVSVKLSKSAFIKSLIFNII